MKRFKDFSIKTKFSLIFLIIGILITAVVARLMYSLVMVDLNKVEDSWIEKVHQSAETVINGKLEALLGIVRDYSYWDDMYRYVNTRDKDWVKINVTDWIPKNFKVDLILIFDAAGKLLYQYGELEELQIDKDLSSRPLIKQALESKETKGLCLTSKGFLFAVSSQIMHTDNSGPRNGTYLYGRLLNGSILEEIKIISGIDLSLIDSNQVLISTAKGHIDRPGNFEDIYNALAHKMPDKFIIYKPNYQYALIYSPLKNIEGKDIGILELIRDRSAIAVFRHSFIKISIWVFILVAFLVLIIVPPITNIILKPLDFLKKTIEEIQKTKDMLKRVKIQKGDEIGVLANDFNVMMDALNKSQNELVEAQQNLIKSEKMATTAELAIGTVHQINNPLSIVIGRAQMLRRLINYKTPIPEADLEKDLKIIEDHTARAVDITNSLLRYANPIMFRFERCDINELLQDIIEAAKELLETKNINIMINLKRDLPVVRYCDAKQMRDVFMNIITNAQQAMPEGGKLEISTDYDEEKDMVRIKFTDNGYGIPQENIKKIFTPFFSTAAERNGLGLAISYNVVKGHRGTIEIESEVGKGSTFTLKIPRGPDYNKEGA